MARGKTVRSNRNPNLHPDLHPDPPGRAPLLEHLRPRLLHLAFAFALPLIPAAATAQSAAAWNKRGENAEVRDNFDAAYEAYRQAHLKKPKDLRYTERFERLRFQAGVAHLERGRILKQNGDLTGALAEFNRAHAIDPSNQAAVQEIQILGIPAPGQPPASNQPAAPAPAGPQAELPPPPPQTDTQIEIGSVTAPVLLHPASNDTITLHAVEDVKFIYQAIGKAAGLNVLFDPDYVSKRIPVDLTQVSLADALRIVGTIAGTFYKPVTPNTIFVAQNTRTKHTDLDELAVQTFYLTNASQQNDANEVTTALRNLLDPSVKVYLVPSQNAIVMRATPDQLLLAQKLLNDLDRARAEVVVDVAVLEVNKDKVRKLGITLPTSFGLTPTATSTNTNGTSTGTSTGTGTGTGTTGTTTTSTNLTLNQLGSLNAANFAVTVGGGQLNALLTDADTRVLQNPNIRATDGQRATLKIGSRIPVATGSYNAGVSTGIASIGVQTQFQYLDIGVNIDMTPTIHFDRDVTLKLKVEVLSQTTTVTISGVDEPVIGQRSAEQTIRLKDGEPSVLAGLLTRTDSRNVNGTPGLGEIPFFKYFFSSQSKETAQDEIIFLLIPHIVRESVLTRLNTRAIDTGTGSSIELRRDPNADLNVPVAPVRPRPTSGVTAANAASAMVGQLSQQAQLPTQPPTGPATAGAQPQTTPAQTGTQTTPSTSTPAQPNAATGGAPQPISLSILPPASTQAVGSTFQVAVMLTGAHDLYSVPIQLGFNPAVLSLVNVDAGDLLGRDRQPVAIVHRDEGNGSVTISTSRPPNTAGVEGQGTIAILTFKAIAPGDSNLLLPRVAARNSTQANLPAIGSGGVVHVK